jgi:hypothetical protein
MVGKVVVDRFVWRRRPPRRAAARLAWSLVLAAGVLGPLWLVFGNEPRTTADGAVNPFALVPWLGAGLFAVVLAPQVLALVRRPYVAGDHYALTVRPGVGRTLVLPWVELEEVCVTEVDEERVLLVRLRPLSRHSGDQPGWWDQGHLRATVREASWVRAYHLAVPLSDFADGSDDLLVEAAGWAPGHVTLVNRTD